MQAIRLLSDFNIEILGRYLANTRNLAPLRVEIAPFGQVVQTLATLDGADLSSDALVMWTRPEALFPSYRKALDFADVSHESIISELDGYIALLTSNAGRAKYVFHATWTLPPGHRGYGMLDYAAGLGISHLLARMNLRLAEGLGEFPNCFLLNAEQWLRHGGARAGIPKQWFASKVPYRNSVFEEAAKDISAALTGLNGKARRLVVVDLDNTIWGGVVGETGWQGIRLGGHDPIGEAFIDFQNQLKAVSAKGVQLAIVSKNDEQVALETIDRHPEMRLRRADFAGWRINWTDKAENIVALTDELKLGLESVVFIDDNPAERDRVRSAFGDRVLVPEWPKDPADYSAALLELRCFDTPTVSVEDRTRTAMYASERGRRAAAGRMGSTEEWLATLHTEVFAGGLNAENVARAAQLFNKTNQMNLRTRRLSEDELRSWSSAEHRRLWVFRVRDCFGDSGLTGILSLELDGYTARIVDFLMSCRVMGRKVEETMVYVAAEYARAQQNIRQLKAEFVPTERNRPCLAFWRNGGFDELVDHVFSWDLERTYPCPSCIALTIEDREAAAVGG
jgi:FkbH-like protein